MDVINDVHVSKGCQANYFIRSPGDITGKGPKAAVPMLQVIKVW